LKVCWHVDMERNCGRCEKCLRTQCALVIAGAPEIHGAFEQPFSLEAIVHLPQVPRRFWVDLADSLVQTPHLNALRQAVQSRLQCPAAAKESAESSSADERQRILFVAPAGSCLSLLPEAMRAKLPGRVVIQEHAPVAEGHRLEMTWMKPSSGQTVL